MRQKLYLPPYSFDLNAARGRRCWDWFSEASALMQQLREARVMAEEYCWRRVRGFPHDVRVIRGNPAILNDAIIHRRNVCDRL